MLVAPKTPDATPSFTPFFIPDNEDDDDNCDMMSQVSTLNTGHTKFTREDPREQLMKNQEEQ